MNKLNKILLSVIIILVITLGFSVFSYFRMKEVAKYILDLHLECITTLTNLEAQIKN